MSHDNSNLDLNREGNKVTKGNLKVGMHKTFQPTCRNVVSKLNKLSKSTEKAIPENGFDSDDEALERPVVKEETIALPYSFGDMNIVEPAHSSPVQCESADDVGATLDAQFVISSVSSTTDRISPTRYSHFFLHTSSSDPLISEGTNHSIPSPPSSQASNIHSRKGEQLETEGIETPLMGCIINNQGDLHLENISPCSNNEQVASLSSPQLAMQDSESPQSEHFLEAIHSVNNPVKAIQPNHLQPDLSQQGISQQSFLQRNPLGQVYQHPNDGKLQQQDHPQHVHSAHPGSFPIVQFQQHQDNPEQTNVDETVFSTPDSLDTVLHGQPSMNNDGLPARMVITSPVNPVIDFAELLNLNDDTARADDDDATNSSQYEPHASNSVSSLVGPTSGALHRLPISRIPLAVVKKPVTDEPVIDAPVAAKSVTKNSRKRGVARKRTTQRRSHTANLRSLDIDQVESNGTVADTVSRVKEERPATASSEFERCSTSNLSAKRKHDSSEADDHKQFQTIRAGCLSVKKKNATVSHQAFTGGKKLKVMEFAFLNGNEMASEKFGIDLEIIVAWNYIDVIPLLNVKLLQNNEVDIDEKINSHLSALMKKNIPLSICALTKLALEIAINIHGVRSKEIYYYWATKFLLRHKIFKKRSVSLERPSTENEKAMDTEANRREIEFVERMELDIAQCNLTKSNRLTEFHKRMINLYGFVYGCEAAAKTFSVGDRSPYVWRQENITSLLDFAVIGIDSSSEIDYKVNKWLITMRQRKGEVSFRTLSNFARDVCKSCYAGDHKKEYKNWAINFLNSHNISEKLRSVDEAAAVPAGKQYNNSEGAGKCNKFGSTNLSTGTLWNQTGGNVKAQKATERTSGSASKPMIILSPKEKSILKRLAVVTAKCGKCGIRKKKGFYPAQSRKDIVEYSFIYKRLRAMKKLGVPLSIITAMLDKVNVIPLLEQSVLRLETCCIVETQINKWLLKNCGGKNKYVSLGAVQLHVHRAFAEANLKHMVMPWSVRFFNMHNIRGKLNFKNCPSMISSKTLSKKKKVHVKENHRQRMVPGLHRGHPGQRLAHGNRTAQDSRLVPVKLEEEGAEGKNMTYDLLRIDSVRCIRKALSEKHCYNVSSNKCDKCSFVCVCLPQPLINVNDNEDFVDKSEKNLQVSPVMKKSPQNTKPSFVQEKLLKSEKIPSEKNLQVSPVTKKSPQNTKPSFVQEKLVKSEKIPSEKNLQVSPVTKKSPQNTKPSFVQEKLVKSEKIPSEKNLQVSPVTKKSPQNTKPSFVQEKLVKSEKIPSEKNPAKNLAQCLESSKDATSLGDTSKTQIVTSSRPTLYTKKSKLEIIEYCCLYSLEEALERFSVPSSTVYYWFRKIDMTHLFITKPSLLKSFPRPLLDWVEERLRHKMRLHLGLVINSATRLLKNRSRYCKWVSDFLRDFDILNIARLTFSTGHESVTADESNCKTVDRETVNSGMQVIVTPENGTKAIDSEGVEAVDTDGIVDSATLQKNAGIPASFSPKINEIQETTKDKTLQHSACKIKKLAKYNKYSKCFYGRRKHRRKLRNKIRSHAADTTAKDSQENMVRPDVNVKEPKLQELSTSINPTCSITPDDKGCVLIDAMLYGVDRAASVHKIPCDLLRLWMNYDISRTICLTKSVGEECECDKKIRLWVDKQVENKQAFTLMTLCHRAVELLSGDQDQTLESVQEFNRWILTLASNDIGKWIKLL